MANLHKANIIGPLIANFGAV
ncbi:unnamed protein product [Acanthoscelides obtectus]|uniref:Uncharacterized protein n=1 Tax=Acanthoscelides obtectus TaxID=200917 RepID=A0A9P0QAA6_ACAOB|nr:unnamed protein product [Acanthoscelides obtectus]CAK1634097.1 hypothetical protein AOBTE_LOCUS8605 [Acanthoscelides obtectus]